MVIYDKNQFTFNILFAIILISSVIINIIFGFNFLKLNEKYTSINSTLAKIEDNQNFNFIQGSHNELNYQLTPTGFFIDGANDYGLFSGPSMQPSIYDKNLMIQKKYQGEKLEEGMVIRFLREDNTPVIHRIRADYGDTVFVQGDSLKEGEIIDKSKITHIIVGILFT